MNSSNDPFWVFDVFEQTERRRLASELRDFMDSDDWSGYFAWLSDHSPESIADLIECDRPKCANAGASGANFLCSRCGYEGNVWRSTLDGDKKGGFVVPRFCPDCGARVVGKRE